tara:strand:- start:155 stop:1054 length:900 start_codon:yes stop_codon:yes gene_type:complete
LGRWKDIQDWKEEKEAEAEFDKRMKLDAKKLGISFEEIKKSFTNKHGYFNYEGYENKIKERFQKIKDAEKRQRLIRNGDPEIDYSKFQKLIKKISKRKKINQVIFYVVIISGLALAFQIQWEYFGLVLPVLLVVFIIFPQSPKKKELETVFGSNICMKYSYSWHKLQNFYLDDLGYYSNFRNVEKTVLNSKDLEKELLNIVELQNKSCPTMLDESTLPLRLDYTEIDTNGFLHHVLTFVSLDSPAGDKTKFKKIQAATISEKYNLDHDFRFYKENGINLRYTYNDKHNKQIVSFVIPEK